MRRHELLHYLRQHGCQFMREGGDHTIWENPQANRKTSIPRHREIHLYTARRICQQLSVPPIGNSNS